MFMKFTLLYFLYFITFMYASTQLSGRFDTSTKSLLRDVGTSTISETDSYIRSSEYQGQVNIKFMPAEVATGVEIIFSVKKSSRQILSFVMLVKTAIIKFTQALI